MPGPHQTSNLTRADASCLAEVSLLEVSEQWESVPHQMEHIVKFLEEFYLAWVSCHPVPLAHPL